MELPCEHTELAKLSSEQDKSGREQKESKNEQFKAAQAVITNALKEGMNHPSYNNASDKIAVADSILNDAATAKLDKEKVSSLLRSVTLLQSEGAQVVQSKQHLLGLLSQTVQSSSMSNTTTLSKEVLEQNKDQLTHIANYLKNNSESVTTETSKPIEDMINLS